MLQQVIRAGSIILLASASLFAMERPSLKDLAIKRVAKLITCHPDLSYCIKAFNIFPNKLMADVVQQIIAINKPKSALPIALLSYKLHQQQQLDSKQYQLRLLLNNNQQIQLTPKQSQELIEHSSTIRNVIGDTKDIQNNTVQAEEIPLLLLTQEQVTALLPYISSINALNINNKALSLLQQEIPEATLLSSYWIKYTALQQLKQHFTACTIPMLCNLLMAANHLNIQNNEQMVNFTELATYALGNKLLQAPKHQDEYNAINALPESIQRMLVSYLIDNSTIRYALCSNSTGVITKTAHILTGHVYGATSVSWSPNGKYIASGSHNIKIWNTLTGICIRTLEGHVVGEWINSISWSPDGKYIASCSNDESVKVLNTQDGTRIHIFCGHTKNINSVSWSPDGEYIASCSWDKTIRIWNINNNCKHVLTGHTKEVNSVSWLSDCNTLESGSNDGTIKLWDTMTGTCIRTLNGYCAVLLSPNGKHIASTPDGYTTYVWGSTDKYKCSFSTSSYPSTWIRSVSWSPDSSKIASIHDHNTIRIWDVLTGNCIYTLTGHTNKVNVIAWSPNGNQIVSCSNDYTIRIWDIIDKELDNYLKNTLSWQQALLLIHIINAHNNQQDIDFTHDTKTLNCYDSLDRQIKQLIEPLLSERVRNALRYMLLRT